MKFFKSWNMHKKKPQISLRLGAENEARTRDPNLGKVVLYQLSYFRISYLCSGRESNPYGHCCPRDFKSRVSTYSTT